jgi:organic hydroperoxide reductase OsmC/OhrA
MSQTHRYATQLEWQGSTRQGYEHYDRRHRVVTGRAETALELSSDAIFRGDEKLTNPEQLLVAAASSCQLLSFLAIAARARIDVTAYSDAAEGIMPEDDPPTRITEIVLRPRITIVSDVPLDRVLHYVQQAHNECYIANSLKSDVRVEPKVEFAERRDGTPDMRPASKSAIAATRRP